MILLIFTWLQHFMTQTKVPFPQLPCNTFPPTVGWVLLAVSHVVGHEKPLSKQDIQHNPLSYNMKTRSMYLSNENGFRCQHWLSLAPVNLTYKQQSFGTLFIMDLLETLSITYLCF